MRGAASHSDPEVELAEGTAEQVSDGFCDDRTQNRAAHEESKEAFLEGCVAGVHGLCSCV